MIAMNLTAQNQLPNLIIDEGHKTTTYQQNGKYLTKKELAEILKSNAESVKQYNKSVTLSNIGGVFTAIGISFCIGGVIATTSSLKAHLDGNNDKASKIMTNAEIGLWSGLGFIIIGTTLGATSVTLKKKSINNYNNTLKSGRIENGTIYFGFTGEGVGIRLRF
jgi:hypothetical protein